MVNDQCLQARIWLLRHGLVALVNDSSMGLGRADLGSVLGPMHGTAGSGWAGAPRWLGLDDMGQTYGGD